MKVLVYWHDMFLPHSAYIIKAFDEYDCIDHAYLLGPEKASNVEPIFNQGEKQQYSTLKKTTLIKVKTYRLMPKCCQLSAYIHHIRLYKPDLVIVLDEPLSLNVFLAGLARQLVQPQQGKVLFYCFENIYSAIPIRYFLDKPNFARLLSTFRKSVRFLFIDKLLMPARKKLVYGGLTSYLECTSYIHRNRWYPKIKEQWWPVNLKIFASQSTSFTDKSLTELASQDRKIIAFVGRFVQEKGIEDIIHALSYLDDDYLLLLIGSGHEQNLVSEWLEKYKVRHKVVLTGPLPSEALVAYLKLIEVIILPSRTTYFWKEQYGRTLVEAMAAQTLVLGSNSGAIPFVINNSYFIYEEGNVQQLIEKIKHIFSLPSPVKAQLVRKNLARAKNADPAKFIESFLAL